MAPTHRAPCWLALGICSLALACRFDGGSGGYEDDLGDSSDMDGALPPDLPQAECDPRRFEDCAPGTKCTHVFDTPFGPTNRCVELLGEGVTGDACEQIGDSDTCANHHICWATNADGLAGVCTSFCTAGLVCGSEGEVCSVSTGGLLSLCLPKCHPLLPSCDAGWGCYADDYGVWSCDLDQSGDAGAHGDACVCLNCCDPGLVCIPGALVDAVGCGGEAPEGEEGEAVETAPGCCAQICDREDEAPPETVCATQLERCEAFYDNDAVLMGYERVGVCEL